MMERHKNPFAKYAGSINSKLIPKLSEQEIKEQEKQFEMIENFFANHDIPRLRSILFNQTESNDGTDKARQETH